MTLLLLLFDRILVFYLFPERLCLFHSHFSHYLNFSRDLVSFHFSYVIVNVQTALLDAWMHEVTFMYFMQFIPEIIRVS